jgi:hypothetical protein
MNTKNRTRAILARSRHTGEFRMRSRLFQPFVALLIVTLGIGVSSCGGASAPEASAATGGAAQEGAPSGIFESPLPDGSVMRLNFRGGGKVDFAMTEGGATNSYEGKWVQNGEVILAEGAEGLTLELRWRGKDLITDSIGMTLTFTRH